MKDEISQQMGSRSIAWLISVPETSKNTILLAIKSYICIFYL